MNGTELLAEFRKNRKEEAFGELVHRYTNLVYSVARRRLANDMLAQEATQAVFIKLAKSPPPLQSAGELVAWLHRTTVHASIDLWRVEARRHAREQQAVTMQPAATEQSAWNDIAPVLDDALNELSDVERQVILLRFFEQKSMRELGQAFGIGEDAAKMRVSRAVERLRTLFQARGVTCGAALLAAALAERAVEAAPAGLVLTLAALRIPAAGAVGGGGFGAWLATVSKAKLDASLATAIVVGTAAILWLGPAANHRASKSGQTTNTNPVSADVNLAGGSGSGITNGAAAADVPNPYKLLQEVARARFRITSGEVQFDVARFEPERAFEGTNHTRLKAVFDDFKRRFESFAREYAYTSRTQGAGAAIDARMRIESLDQEAAVRAGLLKPFDSHHVTAYDGALLLDYWENDGQPVQTKIDDPAKGSGGYLFDPRCLGLDTSLFITDTVEGCLSLNNPGSARLVGEELVEGVPAWHVRIGRGSVNADFWLDKARPVRVLKHQFNGSTVLCKYDDTDPRDAIPIEVTTLFLHGTTGRQTAVSYSRITRTGARFNIEIVPSSWTLAGLEMKPGTEVIDNRNYRLLGYWNGSGFSENPPGNKANPAAAPNRADLMAVLEYAPASPEGFQVALWVISNSPDGPDLNEAAEVILQNHITNTNLVLLTLELERLRPRCTTNLLHAMMEKNPSPDVRGNACFSLATLTKDHAQYGKDKRQTVQAQKLYQRVIAEFGRVKRHGTSLADLARPELRDLVKLSIGQPAPETKGRDLEGQPLNLGDYRGQFVVLSFWGECGGCRPDMVTVRELLDRFKGRPLAMLGVFCDDDLGKAREIAQKIEMPWPSFADARSGPISTAWNNSGWPLYDVIDPNGIIRCRNLSGVELPLALDNLFAKLQ